MKPQDPTPYANHDRVWALLPWYLNGSLKASELELVKEHLRVCLLCRKEAAEQETLYHRLQHAPLVEVSSKPSFQRLLSRIREEEGSRRKSGAKQSANGFAELGGHCRQLLALRRLAVALAMGLLAFSLPWLLRGLSPVSAYHTVANPGSLGQYGKNDIRVVFANQTGEAEIGRIVASVHGQIVDGPTQRSVYTIRIAGDGGHPLSAILQALRGNKAVVFAEPALPPEDGRQGEGG